MIVNTTEGAQAIFDSFSIRSSALTNNVPHYTTMAGAAAAVGAIRMQDAQGANTDKGLEVTPLQSYAKSSA
jgi:carbamoyl-phosphate synthase large subunit